MDPQGPERGESVKKTPMQKFIELANTTGDAKVAKWKDPEVCDTMSQTMRMNLWLERYNYVNTRQLAKIRAGMARKLGLRLNYVSLFVVGYTDNQLMLALYYEPNMSRFKK